MPHRTLRIPNSDSCEERGPKPHTGTRCRRFAGVVPRSLACGNRQALPDRDRTRSQARLQIDHRVPYEVGGHSGERDVGRSEVMLLCGSCNRAKSWTCEHCDNLTGARDSEVCRTCYWGSPEDYRHIALRQMRRVDLVWHGDEVGDFDQVSQRAAETGEELADYIKDAVRKATVVRGEVSPIRSPPTASPAGPSRGASRPATRPRG